MSRYFIFHTGGDWDTTNLYLDGIDYAASKLFIELQTETDEDGRPFRGGLSAGGFMQAFVRPLDPNFPEEAIFPGRIELNFPMRKVTIENRSPQFAIEMTRIWLDEREVTQEVTEIVINIDAIENEVSAYMTLFKDNFLRADEMATYQLI